MTDLSAHESTAKELAVEWLGMIQRNDFSNVADLLDPDVVSEWPQSRERVRGRDNLVNIFTHFPGGTLAQSKAHFVDPTEDAYLMTPMFTMVKASGSGDTANGTILTRYPDGTDWYLILFLKSRSGRIVYNEVYFAPVFPAPEWRAEWVEPMGDVD